jgi:hypothetical protein
MKIKILRGLFLLLLGACSDRIYCTKLSPNYERITVHEQRTDSASGEKFDFAKDSMIEHRSSCAEWMEGRR